MPTEIEDLNDLTELLDSLKMPAPVLPVAASSPSPTPPADAADLPTEDDLAAFLDSIPAPAATPPRAPLAPSAGDEGTGDAASFMQSMGIAQERDVPDFDMPWMKHHKFVRVKTIEEVRSIVDRALAHGRCSLDLETQGLNNRITYDGLGNMRTVHQIVGYCLSVDGKTGYYIPVRHRVFDGGADCNVPPVQVEAEIRRLCLAAQPEGSAESRAKDCLSFPTYTKPPGVRIYFWNAQFDQEFLYPITGIDWWHPDSFEDGILAGFCKFAADKALGLKHKAAEFLRDPDGNAYTMIELKELFIRGRAIEFDTLSPDEQGVVKYGASDAICTYLLCEHPALVPLVLSKYKRTYRLEKQVSQVVRTMERNLVRLDRERVREILTITLAERDAILKKIQEFANQKGFQNLEPSSPKQLSDFLFTDKPGCLNISPKPEVNEKSKQYKTDGETLKSMVDDNPQAPPILKWIVEYRGVEKNIGTYLNGMVNNPDERNELRFSFKQTGAGTGRFSAPAGDPAHGYSGIPVHGIPSESSLRKAFVARDGYTFVKCDYAGQELRIAANVSGEEVWIKEFLEGDGDLHSITARAFFNKPVVSKDERKMGKCVHPDTLIFTNHTLRSLSTLTYPEQENTFRDVETCKVFDGREWRPLKATFNGGVKPLFHIVLSGGLLTCTSEHRFKTRGGEFVRAADLQPGALLEQVEIPQLEDNTYPPLKVELWEGVPAGFYNLNHDYAYFAGVFAGDGTGNDSSASIAHGASEKLDAYGNPFEDWIKSLEESCRRCGFTTSRKDLAQLYLGSRVVVRFLRALSIIGPDRKNLRIPSWVLTTGKQSVLHYLGGLFDTDGTVGGDSPNLDWTTKDFVFAGQVATAMRACGLDFNTELTFNKTYQRYYVRLRLTVGSSWQMRSYMKHVGKVGRLREPIYNGHKKDRFEVLQVLPAADGQCVDLTVGDSHVYLANGFVTHNTANFALIYGGGPQAIIRATGCDKVEASRRKQAFDKAVPKFAGWIKHQHATVKKDLGVWTPFGRWLAIPDANHQEKAIQAACERYSTNYPIQGSGADIMKISMVILHKAFYERGWLKSGGDDSVRMLLSVHDEIVFEIRHDRVTEAIPLIVRLMESPTYMTSPTWRVPLVVEPLVGPNWGSGYKCEKTKGAYKVKEGEVIVGDFVYGTIRSADIGQDREEEGEVEHKRDDKKIYIRIVDPAWLQNVKDQISTPPPAEVHPEIPPPAIEAVIPKAPAVPSMAPTASVAAPKTNGKLHTVTMKICRLNKHTIRQVRHICIDALSAHGSLLRLTDSAGTVIIDPALGVIVDAKMLAAMLFDYNIGDGEYAEDP